MFVLNDSAITFLFDGPKAMVNSTHVNTVKTYKRRQDEDQDQFNDSLSVDHLVLEA
jgi:hypothetical protein